MYAKYIVINAKYIVINFWEDLKKITGHGNKTQIKSFLNK